VVPLNISIDSKGENENMTIKNKIINIIETVSEKVLQ
jgi:hypothetical protein